MKTNKNRILIMVVSLAMCIFMLAACAPAGTTTPPTSVTTTAKSTETGSTDWEYTKDTSAFTFDIWWVSDWGFNKPAIESGWDATNPVYKQITDKTGATINFLKPAGTEDDLLGPMMAAGNLPDVMVLSSYKSPYFNQMKEADQIHAWSDLIDQYCPNMWGVLPESLKTLHKDQTDGKLWAYVSMIADAVSGAGLESIGQPATAQSNICFARKDILAAFGQTDITDIDMLTDYLKFCKENYPDVDPIRLFNSGDPRSTSDSFFKHLGSTFDVHLSGTYPVGDGTLKLFMYDPKYVEYLKWLNGLFKDGLITTNMLAEDAQAQSTKTYNSGYGFIVDSMWGAFGTVNDSIKKNQGNDTKTYIDVGPIKKDGKWSCDGYRNMGAFATVITKNAKLPDRIIKCFEYLNTEEGQLLINAGPEGWAYNTVDGKLVPIKEAIDLASTDLEGYTTKYRLSGPWAFTSQDYYWEVYLGQLLTPDGYKKTQTFTRLKSYIHPIWDEGFIDIVGNSVQTGSDLDVLYTKIVGSSQSPGMCQEAANKMITAGSDADFQKIYNDCIAQIEAAGVDQINKALTDTYKKNLEILGLK